MRPVYGFSESPGCLNLKGQNGEHVRSMGDGRGRALHMGILGFSLTGTPSASRSLRFVMEKAFCLLIRVDVEKWLRQGKRPPIRDTAYC